jgi:hypothetical protein
MRDLLLTTRIWVRGTWLAVGHPRLLIGYPDDRRAAEARPEAAAVHGGLRGIG